MCFLFWIEGKGGHIVNKTDLAKYKILVWSFFCLNSIFFKKLFFAFDQNFQDLLKITLTV